MPFAVRVMLNKPTVVRKLIKQRLCTVLDAEDIAMVAAERTCTREALLGDNPRKVWGYLWRTARNLAISEYRKRKRAKVEFETVDWETDERLTCPGPQTRHAIANAREALEKAFAALSPEQRTCLTLKREEGLSIAAIVRQTGLPRHRVKAALFKGGRTLRALLRQTLRQMREALAEGH